MLKLGGEDTSLPTDEEFETIFSGLQEGSTNPQITEEHKEQLTTLVTTAYQDPDLPKDKVRDLAQHLVAIQELKSDHEVPKTWGYNELVAGFNAGITTLREDPESGDAIVAMNSVFSTDTDSTYGSESGDESATALSVYADETLRSAYHLPDEPLTPEQFHQLQGQLNELYLDSQVDSYDADELVYHLYGFYSTPSKDTDQLPAHDFETVSAGLQTAIETLMHKKTLTEAKAAFDAVLTGTESPVGKVAQNGNEPPIDLIDT